MTERKLLLVLVALVLTIATALALDSLERQTGAQEVPTCNAEGACIIPPLTITRAEPVVAAPAFTG